MLFALALLYPTLTTAQDIKLQSSLDATAEALSLLDLKASDCLDALDSDADSRSLCDEFMAAIDGELLANYLRNCRELKVWRDDYVERSVASGADADNGDNEEMLRRLVAIEYSCGEDSVLRRTAFVATAFDRLRGSRGSTTGTTDSASLSRKLSERRFDALEESERRRLLNALQDQQNRSRRESERQFNDLENELLRQQIQNANRPRN